MSNNLVVPAGVNALGRFEPKNIEEAYRLAQYAVASKLVPQAVDTPEKAMIIMIHGAELGLTAMQSLRTIHVIEGKPCPSADLLEGLCIRSPACEYFHCLKTTDQVATYETKRVGHEPMVLSWTYEQAITAGLTNKKNWRTYRQQMLRSRCKSDLSRMVYPDVLNGFYSHEEMSGEIIDIQPVQREEEQAPHPPDTPTCLTLSDVQVGVETAKKTETCTELPPPHSESSTASPEDGSSAAGTEPSPETPAASSVGWNESYSRKELAAMRKPMLLQLAEHVGCTFSGRVTKEAIVNALDRHYNPVNPIDLGEVEIAIPDPIPESQDSREGSEAGSCPTGSGDNGGLPTPTQTSSPHQHLVDKVLDVLAGTGVDPAKWNFMLGEMTFKTVELEALKAGQIGEELLERLLEVIPEKLHDFKEALEFAKSRGFKVPF